MGTYVNPEIDNFRSSINYKFYVDKSMLIALLNEKLEGVDRFLCVSRPRRFGKTMAANMIAAYYSKGRDSHELFSDLKISKDPSYEENINKYTVLKLDLNGVATKKGIFTIVQYLKKKVIPELIEAYPNIGLSKDDQIPELLVNIHKATGDKFVFIIDEYDLPIREEKYSAEFEEYIDFLISLFKSEDTNYTIALAYLTGIMPIIKEKTQSKLNNFIEYTMIDPDEMAPFMGFIEDEVKDLSSKVGMDFEEQKRWYDGYNLDGLDVYSPKSVISSVTKKRCDDYWVETSSYEAVTDYISLDFKGLKEDVISMFAGNKVEVRTSFYRNTMSFETKDDVLTYLEQHYCEADLSQGQVAEAFQISTYALSRMFKTQMGIGFTEYINAKRIELAKDLLRETNETTKDIAIQVGLPNYNYFLRLFKTITGQTPSAYRTAAQMSKD